MVLKSYSNNLHGVYIKFNIGHVKKKKKKKLKPIVIHSNVSRSLLSVFPLHTLRHTNTRINTRTNRHPHPYRQCTFPIDFKQKS